MEEIVIEVALDDNIVIEKGEGWIELQHSIHSVVMYETEARQLADGIYRMLGDKAIVIPDNYGYDDFANDVANTLKDGYGEHLYNDFMNSLTAKLEKNG